MTAAAALALLLGSSSAARAGSYAYSQQALTGLKLSTGGTLTGVTITATTTSSAAFESGASFSGSSDVKQAYVGTPPKPAENLFSQYATFASSPPAAGSMPTTPGDSFSRGDARITGAANIFTTGASLNNAAETYLADAGGHLIGSGSGTWSLAVTFTYHGGPSALHFSYGYANSVFASVAGNGLAAEGDYNVDFTLKTAAGAKVFEADPSPLSRGDSAPPSTLFLSSGGTTSFDTATYDPSHAYTLVDGTTYKLTMSGGEVTTASLVPEPSSVVMMGLGALGLIGLARKRLRTR